MGTGSGIATAVGEWIRANEATVTQWRRHIHAHPELSHEEVATTAFISEVLCEHGLNPVPFPGTGLYVDLGPTDGERLAFRADIDALSVAEISGLEFASGTPGCRTPAATTCTPPSVWRWPAHSRSWIWTTASGSSSSLRRRSWAAAQWT